MVDEASTEFCALTISCYFDQIDECFDATTRGLWKKDLSWSREAGELQKSALTGQASNTLVKRAKSTVKHLRIVDKKVY